MEQRVFCFHRKYTVHFKKNPVPFSKFPDGINVNFISAGLGSKHRSDTPLALCPLCHRYSLSVAVASENENED